ncbi:poly(A) RNA polymerase, mitochondrial-like [Clavelina lepadiformis]|uniref:poly(A) RNA polymerase, mitochondrial-like n=1 Tax=Clavelina lepadiformis TaxID=159417 RepID=UPI00404342C0
MQLFKIWKQNVKYITILKRYVTTLHASSAGPVTIDPLEVLTNSNFSYQDLFFTLHHQAQKSMFLHVDVDPATDQQCLADALHPFCSKMGNVLYLKPVSNSLNYFLVEFSTAEGVLNLSNACTEGSLNLHMAKLSPSGMKQNLIKKKGVLSNSNRKISLQQKLRDAATMSEQMNVYYENARSSSDDVRKKLFLPTLLQDFFNFRMKTKFTAVPFGTVMMGLGTEQSDIDLSLTRLSLAKNSKLNSTITTLHDLPTKSAEAYVSLHRSGTHSLFSAASAEIGKHFPGVSGVTNHDAVVPILKLHFAPFSSDVDISLENKVGMQTGWIFNMYVRIDKRVAPFLFLLRQWTKHNGLSQHGGTLYYGLTPFMVTCLGLFYLMRVQPAVIPPMINMLTPRATPDDLILGKFHTKINNNVLNFKSENYSSVEELFRNCLEYYRLLEFNEFELCLATGTAKNVMQSVFHASADLHIKIPLSNMNVGKNCSYQSLKKFQKSAETLIRRFESRKRHKHNEWGVLAAVTLEKS